jgi:hypothetical protein
MNALPSEFSIIFAAVPSMIATAELVVPVEERCEHAIKFFIQRKGVKHTQVNTDDWSPNLLVGII